MASITTATVGNNAQPLAPAPVAGAEAAIVTIINLDTENTVNLGSSATNLALELGPLASVTLTAPVWAGAAERLQVGIIPGGGGYSPGSLTITGPVTATITGTVEADVTGTVAISSGTVDATVTGTVSIDAGSVTFTNDQIAVNGVGGFVAPGAYSLVLNDTTAHTVASTGSYSTAVFNMQTFSSYTIAVEGYCGAQANTGAPLCIPVIVSYYADSAGTVLIDSERWWMWLANSSAAATPIQGSGPLRGGWVKVTVANPVGSEPVTVTEINLYGAGRPLSDSVWQQTPPAAISSGTTMLPSGAPLVPLPGDDRILANESNNLFLSVNSVYWQPMPLFAGEVSMYFQSSLALANDFVVASAQGLVYGEVVAGTATHGVLWNPASAAGTSYAADIEAGNAPMYFVIHTGSTSPSITYTAQGH